MCHLADAVLSGGIRRSAMISLFSHDDYEMMECKFGNWWELNGQRGRSNNSVVLDRNEITEDQFKEIWSKVEMSGSGEPGIYWTNNKDWGTNPCCEIALRPYQFCNLCEVNVSDIQSQSDLNERVKIAAFFGTLQAGFTDFHYLRSIWKKTTEEDALIGVGMTGIASGKVLNLDLKQAANIVKLENKEIADLININQAARTTTIKPSGTTSCVLGTSSGIHAWHNDYYIRRIRVMKNDPLYYYLFMYHPQLIEDDKLQSHNTAIISIPQEAPQGSILRTESAMDLLQRINKFNIEWVKEGHQKGDNTNNVSATVSIDKSKIYEFKSFNLNEWEVVGDWMWYNKDSYNGISVLPYDNGSYIQAPFENCTKEKFLELSKNLNEIDLTKVIEEDDNVNFTENLACGPDGCEVK
jgi:ribonucleoside-triphosphate reductase